MCKHMDANIYGVGVKCYQLQRSEQVTQLCLNPTLAWPPPQLNSLVSCLPLSCHIFYIILYPRHPHFYHTHRPPSPSTTSSLECHHQQHHSSQESTSRSAAPTYSPWCRGAPSDWLPPTTSPLRLHCVALMSQALVYLCLQSSSVNV